MTTTSCTLETSWVGITAIGRAITFASIPRGNWPREAVKGTKVAIIGTWLSTSVALFLAVHTIPTWRLHAQSAVSLDWVSVTLRAARVSCLWLLVLGAHALGFEILARPLASLTEATRRAHRRVLGTLSTLCARSSARTLCRRRSALLDGACGPGRLVRHLHLSRGAKPASQGQNHDHA